MHIYFIMRRKLFFLGLFMLCCTITFGQHTQLYSNVDATYADGLTAYYEGKYAASYAKLTSYINAGQGNYLADATFYQIANAFELRQKSAAKQLQNYLSTYPYTTYASEVHFMLGVLQVERNKQKKAIKEFALVKEKELFRNHEAAYFFYYGYAYLTQEAEGKEEMSNVKRASSYFTKLKKLNSQYDLQARYYYAYCQYKLQKYGRALPDFLALEKTAQYEHIVPYYIIQIYYDQGQYDEVAARADFLLTHASNNTNNAEIHRLMGEIAFQNGDYKKAKTHLTSYVNIRKASVPEEGTKSKRKKKEEPELVREDLYLLGMTCFYTEDWKNAVRYLNMAAKGSNDEMAVNSFYHAAQANIHLGNYEKAKMAYNSTIRHAKEPLREEAMYNCALASYQSATAFGESVIAFTDFLKEYPKSKYCEQIYEIMCDAFVGSKNYKAALDALNHVENPTPKMQETKQFLRYQIGTDAFAQSKWQEASNYFKDVIENSKATSKHKTDSYFWRAECAYRMNKFTEAAEDWKRFLAQKNAKESEQYNLANYSLGYAFFSQSKYDEARKYFESGFKHLDTERLADAKNRIGDCYFSARKYKEAEKAYAEVIQMNKIGVDYALFQRAYALGLLKKYDTKITLLNSLVKRFPKSNYADDALYEIARAYIQKEDEKAAIETYDRLLKHYPNSSLKRKSALEKAMLYYNMHDYEKTIASYKNIIKNYPGSEEAYAALDGLEAIYVELDRVDEYLAYTKSLGKLNMTINNQEDSLTYAAAERQYLLANYPSAVAGLGKYISQYCDGGRYCLTARYYFANSHYQLAHVAEAMAAYEDLFEIAGNPYMEEACMRIAELAYDTKDYVKALPYFEALQHIASQQETINAARLGVLRCSYLIGNNDNTIRIAQLIIEDPASSADMIMEAHYNAGKAHMTLHQYADAIPHLLPVAEDVRTIQGAEAKHLISEAYFALKNLDESESTILSFASMNTPHPFWLAKSFLLLSDIYVERGDDFQAKQYLLSLQSNYKAQDEIQDLITKLLDAITARENPVKQTENEDNDEEDL